jgi:hypothetical protein
MTKLTFADFLHLDLNVGNVICFTNSVGYYSEYTITRIRHKSVYLNGGRNSWNTFKKLTIYPDFKIIN